MKDVVDLAAYYKCCALMNGPNKQVPSRSALILRQAAQDNAPFRSSPVLC